MLHVVKCPTCRKETLWQENPYRPFCSERCRLIDLGTWADESYRIPGEQVAEAAADVEAEEQKSLSRLKFVAVTLRQRPSGQVGPTRVGL